MPWPDEPALGAARLSVNLITDGAGLSITPRHYTIPSLDRLKEEKEKSTGSGTEVALNLITQKKLLPTGSRPTLGTSQAAPWPPKYAMSLSIREAR